MPHHAKTPLRILSLLALSVAVATPTAKATVNAWGGVWPITHDDLTLGYDCSIGADSDGGISVSDNDLLTSRDIYLGYDHPGTMNVSTGATWNCNNLELGYYGIGTLNIASGGKVNSDSSTMGEFIYAHAPGTANIDGSGSAWTIKGNLRISGDGKSVLKITNGGTVTNVIGTLGNASKAIVDGANSQWTNSGFLYVGGNYPTGALTISNGGTVTSSGARIEGNDPKGSSVSVTGAQSVWNNTGSLWMDYYSPATLTIAGGGKVASSSLDAGFKSNIAMAVGDTSSLELSGEMLDRGTVRLSAAAKVPAGVYTPIKAGSWTDSACTYVSVGGKWDRATHEFTVSAAAKGSAGNTVSITPSSTQKILITGSDGKNVGASFLPGTGSQELLFTANTLSAAESGALNGALDPGQAILAGWTFAATGAYSQGAPAYLSLEIGSGHSGTELKIWHYDINGWMDYSSKITDLSYDGTYANFTVTGFSGYAVTGVPVPEPTAMLLMFPGAVLVMRRQRKTRD